MIRSAVSETVRRFSALVGPQVAGTCLDVLARDRLVGLQVVKVQDNRLTAETVELDIACRLTSLDDVRAEVDVRAGVEHHVHRGGAPCATRIGAPRRRHERS